MNPYSFHIAKKMMKDRTNEFFRTSVVNEITSNKAMDLRKPFFDNLLKIAKKDKKVMFLTGDLGFGFTEGFQKALPAQFINCGCIEQSMVGIASGMALGGLKPYVYSTTPFILMRAYEQIRDDVAYNNLNVKLIGTGASGFLGFSHNLEGKENEEDLLKNLPNIKDYYPNREDALKLIMELEYKRNGPAFIRI